MSNDRINEKDALFGQENSSVLDEDRINLLDCFLVLARRKKTIFTTCLVVFVLTCGISLLLPNIYTATARVMPPSDGKSGLSAMLGGMTDLAAFAGLSVGGSSSSAQYVGMINSRSVSDAIIDRFNLMEVYEQQYRVKAYDALADHVTIAVGKEDGIIAIAVEDEDPKRAADMANAYVEELGKINLQINLSSAGRQRVFLEKRLELVKGDLNAAEERLREFQEKNTAIRLDTQAAATIEAISRLKGELASKEVELGVLRSFQTESNPEVKALREEIAQIKGQIQRFEQSPSGKRLAGDVFVTTTEVPELGLQYARLLRDFKVQETIFELTKIEEAKNTSSVQVLDTAVPPDRKSKPKRALIVLLATFVAGFGAMIFALIREYAERMPGEDRARLEELRSHLRWQFRWPFSRR
jgi:uncharacterized protein involved in exopolysaccharide biosynthesis